MNIALWIVAGLFGVAYVAGGTVKLTMDHEKYAAKLGWPADFTPGNVRFMGVLEVLGGIGLVLPALVDVVPVLVPIAASCMALYMAGAITERVRRGEYKEMLGDLLFVAAMVFIAWGRFGIEPF
jgi:uncharacterized membrane protein